MVGYIKTVLITRGHACGITVNTYGYFRIVVTKTMLLEINILRNSILLYR